MPRQDKRIPLGFGRFTYWDFAPGLPFKTRLQEKVIRDALGMENKWDPGESDGIAKQFREIWARKTRPIVPAEPPPWEDVTAMLYGPFEALGYYAEHDKMWEQDDLLARETFKELEPHEQAVIRDIERKWHIRTTRPLKDLLQTIAIDQAYYREVLEGRPVKVGLIASGRTCETRALHGLFGLTHGDADRVYRKYNKRLRRHFNIPTNAKIGAWLRKHGLLEDGAMLAMHWLNHCLHNLGEWRNGRGKSSIPYEENDIACAQACRKYQDSLWAQR